MFKDISLYERTVQKLIRAGLHISFAESCTGGLCSAALVSVADASRVFDASFVTYANEAKMRFLGVSEAVINEYGVVSQQVAGSMAQGAAQAAGSEVGVGITGVAGPTGGTAKKPVGMVCFGFYINGCTKTCTCCFGDIGRNAVRQKSVDFVFEKLNELL